jgi:pyridoxamine-phosphate oxidase
LACGLIFLVLGGMITIKRKCTKPNVGASAKDTWQRMIGKSHSSKVTFADCLGGSQYRLNFYRQFTVWFTTREIMDFQAIRKEYENQGIDEALLPENPIELFRSWYEVAVAKSPGKWMEPNVMSLATSDMTGHVTNRYVLLKHIEDNGIQFFTNYDSTKGKQLAENPQCSVAFHWPYLGRQVRMEGKVEKTSRDVSEKYFHSRPRGSQIGAAASLQSSEVESRKYLDDQRQKLTEKYEGQAIPLPENWGGYLIVPARIEFWQGRLDRLHDRVVYRANNEGWTRCRLSP